uniref:Uncharacterized protein n=1 Tax=Solanum lycopersicum TaxID=4081 RepID=A0A3Q7F1H2_SOLLC
MVQQNVFNLSSQSPILLIQESNREELHVRLRNARFMSNAPRNKILQAYVISLMPEGPDFLA